MAKTLGMVSDKILSIAFDKEKFAERWLILLLVAGFVLRLIAALNLGVLADDMLYASQSAGISSAKILSTHSNPPLFFYLTDLAYWLLGYTTLASRFFQLIFGTLLILIVFLLTRKLFDSKTALIASFFVTFSTFLIRNTFAEAGLFTLFFCFLGAYLGIEYLDAKKSYLLFLSAISFGLASLIKYNAPFFILAFLVFSYLYMGKKGERPIAKPNVKKLISFVFIIFMLSMPFLAFNYLLYKDKGITDVYFSRLFPNEKSQQLYAGLGGQENSFVDNLLTPGSYLQLYSIPLSIDQLLFVFAILGIVLLYVRKANTQLYFIGSFFIIPFILQSAGSTLAKHFVFMPLLASIPAAYFFNSMLSRMPKKAYKIFSIAVIAVIMLLSIGSSYGTPQNLLSKSDVSQLKSFIDKNVRNSDFIIFDPRIYTAQALWISTPKQTANLLTLAQLSQADQGEANKNLYDAYFIECLADDCGWGTISQQQELNATAEFLFEQIKNQTAPLKTITAYKYHGNEIFGSKQPQERFAVYKLKLFWSPRLVATLAQTNVFYFTPYLYKNMDNYFYAYEKHSAFDRILEKLSLYIIYLAIILAILFIFLPFRYL